MLAEFETYFAPDFEWTPGMVALGRSTYRGRDGYARYVSELAATSVETKMVDYEIRAVSDDKVLILGTLCIVGRESGVPLENEYAMLYRAEGGLLKAGWSFLSHEDAEAKARELEAELPDA
jgi:ketosteroid isomerase-like protein